MTDKPHLGTAAAELTVVLFSGPDCATFLQGYLTCDTQALVTAAINSALAPNQPPTVTTALPTALCNIKGRVVANGWAWAHREPGADEATQPAIAVATHASVAQALCDSLQRYLVFSKTSVAQLSSSHLEATVDQALQPGAIVIDPRRCLYLMATDQASSAAPATHAAFIDSLLQDRRLLVNAACSEQFLPQMLGLEHWGAIDFDKGCYLGQEVVARAQHRGQVKRQLTGLYGAQQPLAPDPSLVGASLLDPQGKTVGTLVQVRTVPRQAEGSLDALAVVAAAVRERGQALTIQGSDTLLELHAHPS